jgi:flagellar hook protein FlgE
VGGGTINVNVGIPGQTTGLTQLSSTFAPVTITKDGSSVASLASVEIDEQGFLYAIYDLGVSRKIYQIPVVDVPNPNDLIALSSQTYTVSHDSGDLYLWDAGDGPAGTIAGFSLEESGTDVAAELTQLIKTQRAYSSNAKVIQTVDEMLQETTNIKR